jgi:UDP-2-acetamido-3-amino-2,3-dideoxy-glucuronate N-acetyltransferase
MKDVQIGQNCILGQNVHVSSGVVIGNNVKVQNNISISTGVVIEDDVFCGPSIVFTNVFNPRSAYPKDKNEYLKTCVQKGTTIGANATIICGNDLGRYSFIGAGSVVTKTIPDYALYYGNPARFKSWICECGILIENFP